MSGNTYRILYLVAGKLNTLKRGIRIALDIWEGYSALNYHPNCPSTVKIDKSFTDIIAVGEESGILTDFMLKILKDETQIVGDR